MLKERIINCYFFAKRRMDSCNRGYGIAMLSAGVAAFGQSKGEAPEQSDACSRTMPSRTATCPRGRVGGIGIGECTTPEVGQKSSLYGEMIVGRVFSACFSAGWGKDLGYSSQLRRNCTIDKYAY